MQQVSIFVFDRVGNPLEQGLDISWCYRQLKFIWNSSVNILFEK